jgi:hypothetical protein
MRKINLILASFMLLSFNNLSGQVVYTDIIPDSTISASDTEVTKSYYIDLDNNGSYEFELRHFNPGPGNEDVEIQQNFNSIQQIIIDANGHSKVLARGDTINSKSTLWGGDGYGILNSPWYGAGDKYFGFRFKVNLAWYYGWARVNMPADHLSFTIKDYAYNSVPNAPIYAGQTSSSGINKQAVIPKNLVTVYPNPCKYSVEFRFKYPVNNAVINIYNFQGQKIKTITDISGNKQMMYSGDLKCGMYFYELLSENKIVDTGIFIRE